VFTFVSFCCLRLYYVHFNMHMIFDDSHVLATSPPCSCAVAQARLKMSCIRLVYIYCHSLGNWIGLSAPGIEFIQASYTADTYGRAARALTMSDHVMYNFNLGESSDSHFPNCEAVSAPLQDITSTVVLLYNNFQVW